MPEAHLGQYLDARADRELVKLYTSGSGGGRLDKTHPRQAPGRRSTDRADLPEHRAGYALRDLTALIATCASHGPSIGIHAERLLDEPLPWTRMRAVYRLLGLVRRYGADPVEAACSRSLDLDVVSVTKIANMLQRATEHAAPVLPAAAGSAVLVRSLSGLPPRVLGWVPEAPSAVPLVGVCSWECPCGTWLSLECCSSSSPWWWVSRSW